MLKEFKNALIAALDAIDEGLTVREYRGELSDPETAKALAKELPLVMVDLIDHNPDGATRANALFNLYFVHIAYTSHTGMKEAAKWELVDLIERVDAAYTAKSFGGSGYVMPDRARKLFDGKAGTGYLTAFVRTIRVPLRK